MSKSWDQNSREESQRGELINGDLRHEEEAADKKLQEATQNCSQRYKSIKTSVRSLPLMAGGGPGKKIMRQNEIIKDYIPYE